MEDFFNIDTINEMDLNSVIYIRTRFYKDYLENRAAKSVLDVGEQWLRKVFLTNENYVTNIDNLGQPEFKLHRSFYRKCCEQYAEIEKQYDILFLWGDFEESICWNNLIEIAKNTIIWTIPYSYLTRKDYATKTDLLQNWGRNGFFCFLMQSCMCSKRKRENLIVKFLL